MEAPTKIPLTSVIVKIDIGEEYCSFVFSTSPAIRPLFVQLDTRVYNILSEKGFGQGYFFPMVIKGEVVLVLRTIIPEGGFNSQTLEVLIESGKKMFEENYQILKGIADFNPEELEATLKKIKLPKLQNDMRLCDCIFDYVSTKSPGYYEDVYGGNRDLDSLGTLRFSDEELDFILKFKFSHNILRLEGEYGGGIEVNTNFPWQIKYLFAENDNYSMSNFIVRENRVIATASCVCVNSITEKDVAKLAQIILFMLKESSEKLLLLTKGYSVENPDFNDIGDALRAMSQLKTLKSKVSPTDIGEDIEFDEVENEEEYLPMDDLLGKNVEEE